MVTGLNGTFLRLFIQEKKTSASGSLSSVHAVNKCLSSVHVVEPVIHSWQRTLDMTEDLRARKLVLRTHAHTSTLTCVRNSTYFYKDLEV